jgi:hypothetical protein
VGRPTGEVPTDEWTQNHIGPFLHTVAEVWWCGDEECDCTQAQVHDVYRNRVTGISVIRVFVWEGDYHVGLSFEPGETTAEEDLRAYYESLTPERRAEIHWPSYAEVPR